MTDCCRFILLDFVMRPSLAQTFSHLAGNYTSTKHNPHRHLLIDWSPTHLTGCLDFQTIFSVIIWPTGFLSQDWTSTSCCVWWPLHPSLCFSPVAYNACEREVLHARGCASGPSGSRRWRSSAMCRRMRCERSSYGGRLWRERFEEQMPFQVKHGQNVRAIYAPGGRMHE